MDNIPKSIEAEVLQNILVLLINVDIPHSRGYLKPLDGHRNVYLFNQGRQETKLVTYYIGKYGTCPVAVSRIPPLSEVKNNASTIAMMANQCFPSLVAVISVGAACGIKKKTQIGDVLVSSKVINYDYDITMKGYKPKGEAITIPSPVVKLFAQPVQWPNDAVKKYVKVNRQRIPNVKSGVILSGPYVVDDPAIFGLVMNFANEAIGIEFDGVDRFAKNHHFAIHTIIVKAVCDYEDGKNINVNQHTAVLLAAHLVHTGLSHPRAPEILKG